MKTKLYFPHTIINLDYFIPGLNVGDKFSLTDWLLPENANDSIAGAFVIENVNYNLIYDSELGLSVFYSVISLKKDYGT
jgi:hypothetical protein